VSAVIDNPAQRAFAASPRVGELCAIGDAPRANSPATARAPDLRPKSRYTVPQPSPMKALRGSSIRLFICFLAC
jgi:hypothetical protein